MKKNLLCAAAAFMVGVGSLLAEVPSVLSGNWVSEPVVNKDSHGQITTIYDLDLGSGEAVTGVCGFKAKVTVSDFQMGSNVMKVGATINLTGKGTWNLSGNELSLTFNQEDITAKADPASLDLQVPEQMKAAMASRMSEFSAGILGALEQSLPQGVAKEGMKFLNLDCPDANTLTATEDGVAVTFHKR